MDCVRDICLPFRGQFSFLSRVPMNRAEISRSLAVILNAVICLMSLVTAAAVVLALLKSPSRERSLPKPAKAEYASSSEARVLSLVYR